MENEASVSKAFGKQSAIFDDVYDSNPIVTYMRGIIRQQVLSGLHANDHILEINAGTGTDALFFAKSGYEVTAIDISPEMVRIAREKISSQNMNNAVTFIQKSFEEVHEIEGTFDYVYSNFGGLNCTPNITKVVRLLMDKLKSGGKICLTILPPFTLWEKLYILKGDFKTALRRKSKGPSIAHIEGVKFNCWYYNPKVIIDAVKEQTQSVSVTGLCIFVPPSFMKTFPGKFPKTFRFLSHVDRLVSKLPFFNRIGDYYMITLTKI